MKRDVELLRTTKPNCYEEYDTEDITRALLELTDTEYTAAENDKLFWDVESAIYHIRTLAQNECNHDYIRVFYNILKHLPEAINAYDFMRERGVI